MRMQAWFFGLLLGLAFAAEALAWQRVELPPPPSEWEKVFPVAINDRGQITGTYTLRGSPLFFSRGFVFDGQTWIDIGTLGGEHTFAKALNNNGEVVGDSDTNLTICQPDGFGGEFCFTERHAFLWSDGVMHDLGTPGALSSATGVNDAGTTVGWSGNLAQRWLPSGEADRR